MKTGLKSKLLALTLALVVAILPSGALAKGIKQNFTNDQIDAILLQKKMPIDKVLSLDPDFKRTIVENSDPLSEYAYSETTTFYRDDLTGKLVKDAIVEDGMISFAAISRSDLGFNIIAFTTSTANQYEIFATFEWSKTGSGPSNGPSGIYKDMFSIAVPTGWQIQSGTSNYGATMYKTYWNGATAQWSDWINDGSNGFENSGQPASDGYSMYGAAWRMNSSTNTNSYRFKGVTWLTMKSLTSPPDKRVIVSYMEAKDNPLGGFGVQLGWGPLAITYTPTSGSVNTANQDYTWNY